MPGVRNDSINTVELDNCAVAESCLHLKFNSESSTIITEWGLVCDRAWMGKFTTSIQMLGLALGNLISGQLAERFVVKFMLYFWGIMGTVTNGLVIFSVNWEMYVVF